MKFFPITTSTILFVIASIALGGTMFALYITHHTQPTQQVSAHRTYPQVLVLDPQTITAKAALVYDPATRRVLYDKGGALSLPLASLTKLMTAQAVLSSQSATSTVTITPDDLKPEGDWGFRPGDKVKLADLVRFGLVASSNDAMAAAAASIGQDYVVALNGAAGKLGLRHTLFLNSTGLDVNSDTSGAYGSALDVAMLTSAFLHNYPQFFESTASATVSIPDGDHILSAKATTVPLQDIPGFIGAKTGYTDLAGGNLVAAFDLDVGHPVIVVVLNSTESGRFTDVRTLIDAVRAQNL